jgi:hypothetical protein
MLTKTAQQEGLSAINPQMVGNIEFAAGGFGAEYGGRMSSVLDVQYKRPMQNGGSAEAGILGGAAAAQFITPSSKFSGIAGLRHRRSEYLLSTLDDAGEYKPRFYDAQMLLHYDASPQWSLHFFGVYALNQYDFRPQNRNTIYTTLTPINFMSYNEGSQHDQYTNGMAMVNAAYRPYSNISLDLTISGAAMREQEGLDILSEYFLTWASNEQNKDNYDVGGLRQHVRNSLSTRIVQAAHTGRWTNDYGLLQWGVQAQVYAIDDDVYRWQMLDSAGYMYPHTNGALVMSDFVQAQHSVFNHRYSAYLQQTFNVAVGDAGLLRINAGARVEHSAWSKEWLLSPRVQAVFMPDRHQHLRLHAAAGLYHQMPFYKEIKDGYAALHTARTAQKSLHIVAGANTILSVYDVPCKFMAEAYYKRLYDFIPYTQEDVGAEYFPQHTARGNIWGVDVRLAAELTQGVESWLSMSLMGAGQDVVGDAQGMLPLPTDQRFYASLMLQDRMPRNPHWQAYVLMHYGSPLPVYISGKSSGVASGMTSGGLSGVPAQYVRMPYYLRADMGLTYVFWDKMLRYRVPFADVVKALSLTFEIMNVFDRRNVASYLWVPTIVDAGLYSVAVPNYLTPRLFNVRVGVKF